MKKLFIVSLILFIAVTCLVNCDNFVEVDTPLSQLSRTQIFENRSTADAAMTDIYSKLRDTGVLTGLATSASINLGMYADELVYFGVDIDPGIPFTNNLLPSNAIVTQSWNESYHQIYNANAVIEGVANSRTLTQDDKDQFTGEALFVRALVHFYLVNIYGDVPYITSTDYHTNRLAPRLPASLVYQKIIYDLNEAVALLPSEYISPERARPNKSVANALLARVYLYNKSWAEASNAASAVLNNSEYVLEPDLDREFLKESTSTIWQFAPKFSGDNTNEAINFIFVEGPPPFVALSDQFVASFESGDLRRSHWIQEVSDGTSTWFHPYKYKQNENTGESLEYSIVFRIAEQYLIRAEARAQQGDLIGAKEDLNKVRNRAGLINTTAITSDQIVDAILNERRAELFTEFGHRFFDLKRTGRLDAVLGPVKTGWNTSDMLWPIPETELEANPNLGQQNPGY